MANGIQQIKDLGYNVVEIDDGDTPVAYQIDGFGVNVIYAVGDTSALKSIIDGHNLRVIQRDHPNAMAYISRAAAFGYMVSIQDGKVVVSNKGTSTTYTLADLKASIDNGTLQALVPPLAAIEERIANAASAAVGAVIPALAPNATAAQRQEAVDGARAAALEAVQE